ncbi:hemolysin family protein [Caldisalinibacter kiritimatiensis]|uniref:Magnesium and cobalt efflux protein CorC n=1 Tax=Caldisalinibacter kiritimatiensis TaxID=1304284 RepID=R1CHW3_9FIRM|nr:hemolysin family protein [Caldisalinibacter kiritimatiensis]EOD01875.1 Magnesium and cobalt efflux protein CorC [Caldisalinibacter kiritimatiensis]
MSYFELYIRIFILFIFLLLSAAFSSSETALTSLTVSKIRKIREYNEEGANLLRRAKKKLNIILTTILIGNNIVNIAATAILTELTVTLFKGSNSTLIATAIMTTLILIFGEITPKSFAAQNPAKVAIKSIKILEFLSKIFWPIIFILNKITTFIVKILGGKVESNQYFVTEEEIRLMVDIGEEEGVLEQQEREMIEGVFEIDDIEVTEVMVPRIDIIAVSEDATLNEVLDLIITYGHSRIPVFKDSIDNIVGILYAKDTLTVLSKDTYKEEISISKLMRPAYYVPETKKINKLLKELQQNKIHMAIVLDEYGGTEGLVTIEDILEEIVGDILDEYDNEIDMIEKTDDSLYLVKAGVSLEEINEIFNTDLPEEDFDSLGGFVFSTLGRLPVRGDIVEYDDLCMTVTKVQNRRIKQIQISKIRNDQ